MSAQDLLSPSLKNINPILPFFDPQGIQSVFYFSVRGSIFKKIAGPRRELFLTKSRSLEKYHAGEKPGL
jgi:hypothetical protein